MEEDSESDSDYVPEDNAEIDDKDNGKQMSSLVDISFGRKRKADSAWEEMIADDRKFISEIMANAIHNQIIPLERPAKRFRRSIKSFKAWFKGFTYGNVSMESEAAKYKSAADKIEEDNLKQKALESARKVLRKTKVVETRKFAGQEITIEKTVNASKVEVPKVLEKTTGLDKALDTIKGPKVINTVLKSSSDWDNYKEKEGLDDVLAEAAAKNSYLARKEFLERCDVRNFEIERDQRFANANSTK